MTLLIICVATPLPAADGALNRTGEIRSGIRAEGSCAIVGMSAEQSQLLALQRARSSAIEQAAGVNVRSSTLVTNFTVAADFIKTYSSGYIIREEVAWQPLAQYQKDSSTAPIPEYRVSIIADVYVPTRKAPLLFPRAKLNAALFRNGEKARLFIQTARDAGIAIFNITADDKVSLLFPNSYDRENVIPAGREYAFPAKGSPLEMEMQTLPGHQKDAEAFFIVAWDPSREIKIGHVFAESERMSLSEYFRRLTQIADHVEEVIVPYEVVSGP